jgi:hypothetical protein
LSALLHGNWLRDRVAVPCHTPAMTKFDVVPRGQGYWLEAVAEDGTRTPLERLDTKARALERIRVLEGREVEQAPETAPWRHDEQKAPPVGARLGW